MTLSEKAISFLEEHIPELASIAFKRERTVSKFLKRDHFYLAR